MHQQARRASCGELIRRLNAINVGLVPTPQRVVMLAACGLGDTGTAAQLLHLVGFARGRAAPAQLVAVEIRLPSSKDAGRDWTDTLDAGAGRTFPLSVLARHVHVPHARQFQDPVIPMANRDRSRVAALPASEEQ